MSLSTTTTPTVLLLNSISYSWNRSAESGISPILSDINLSVQQGEIFGLLGASGSGKTTLVRLILGRLFPSSGIISLLGNRVDGPRNPPTPSDIGYMPQDLVLYQQFTPVEMLRYFGQLYKLSSGEIDQRIDFVLRLLSLKQFLPVESKLTQEYNMQIQQLSGGQKRRISLAIALLHRPRFLILDEPTVGCDPLLRETIWLHLKQLTSTTSSSSTTPVTVFLTTHYIEEARDAQSIGFLRSGRLLVQDSPTALLARFGTTSMEKVFLALCRKANAEQTSGADADQLSPTGAPNGEGSFPFEEVKVEQMLESVKLKSKLELLPPLDIRPSNSNSQILSPLSLLTTHKKRISPNSTVTSTLKDKESSQKASRKPSSLAASKSFSSCFTFNHTNFNHVLRPPEDPFTYTGTPAREHFICPAHLLTLMGKNFRQLRRNSSLLIFFILLPAIEIALIMLCIGREIENIPIAVFNGEPTPDLSLIFLQSIPEGAFSLQTGYESPEAALAAVADSRAHALLQFSPNFSHALRARFFSFAFDEASNGTTDSVGLGSSSPNGTTSSSSSSSSSSSIYDESSVFVRLDMSNQLIGLQVQRQLLKAFLNFAQRLASNMGLSKQTFKPPLNFGEPVYGIQGGASAVVETFIAPGALIMIAFFATTIVTCHLLIHEVRQALIERALIAGASSAEFLFSHITIQSSILMLQLTLMLLTAFKLFAMPYLGSLVLSMSLVTLQGLCGLMYGLMLSATCPDEIYATTLAIGTFFPSVIIGGIFWPVQSMPMALQYLSHALPSTVSIDALRSILLRNWGLRSANVAGAFAVTAFWLAVFLVCALRNFKRRI